MEKYNLNLEALMLEYWRANPDDVELASIMIEFGAEGLSISEYPRDLRERLVRYILSKDKVPTALIVAISKVI